MKKGFLNNTTSKTSEKDDLRDSNMPNEHEISAKFQQLRSRAQEVQGKLNDLEVELSEHHLVSEALQKLPVDRKCFRKVKK